MVSPSGFREKKVGWGLRPVSWKGWLYAIVWAAVICGPFMAMLASHLLIESLVWAVVMMFALLWDVQHVRRELNGTPHEEADVLIIDEDTEPTRVISPHGRTISTCGASPPSGKTATGGDRLDP